MNSRMMRWGLLGLGTLLAATAAAGPVLPHAQLDKPALAVWAPWKGFGIFGTGRPAVERDPTYRLQVFVTVSPPSRVFTGRGLWHIRQSGRSDDPWQKWVPLGGSLYGDPVTAKSYDGRLEVFGCGSGGILQHIAQLDGVNDVWAGWESFPGVSFVGNPAVASNTDGRLEVFVAVATSPTEYTLWHLRQTGQAPPNAWSGWENMGGHLLGSPAVGRNKDGRLEVFARAPGNTLTHIRQTSANGSQWSAWESLGGGTIVGDPAVAANADGRLELFVRSSEKSIWHNWQTATDNNQWSGWNNMNGPVGVVGDPVIALDLDGRLEVFARAPDPAGTSIWVNRQYASYSQYWWGWENLHGQLINEPAVGTDWDGRFEMFDFAIDGGLYLTWQNPMFQWALGSTWRLPMVQGNGLAAVSDGLRAVDLGTSIMHDGRLDFFFGDGPSSGYWADYSDPIGSLQPTGGAAEGSQGDDLRLDRDPSRDFASFDYNWGIVPGLFTWMPFRVYTARGPQTIGQDQTPTGAFSYNHNVYVFAAARLLPDGTASPYPNVDTIGQQQTILTASADPVGPSGPFRVVFTLGTPQTSPKTKDKLLQVAPMVVKNADFPGLPKTDTPDGLIMLGNGLGGYVPGVYLAWMPLRPGRDPDLRELRYFVGILEPQTKLMVDPVGLWSDTSSDAKEIFETRYLWTSLSVGRIRGTGRWIVLYQKTLGDLGPEWPFVTDRAGLHPEKRHDGIYARITTTNKPWDWGPEVTIFDPDREKAWGAYMNDEIGGFAYGAYLLNAYTNWDAANETVTINYLMSTGSPYSSVLMRSQIKINH